MKELDVRETLKTLSAKIDELSDALIEKKGGNGIKFNAIVVDMRNAACMGWSFLGGLALGYFISRKK